MQLHDSIVRDSLGRNSGREVKHTGDGILASFTSVTGAVECALGVQERTAGESPRIKIGMSAGEPIEQSRDIYGAAVNLAARICAHAEGGQTLVAGTVRDLSMGKPAAFRALGLVAMKGFDEPVQVYELTGRA